MDFERDVKHAEGHFDPRSAFRPHPVLMGQGRPSVSAGAQVAPLHQFPAHNMPGQDDRGADLAAQQHLLSRPPVPLPPQLRQAHLLLALQQNMLRSQQEASRSPTEVLPQAASLHFWSHWIQLQQHIQAAMLLQSQQLQEKPILPFLQNGLLGQKHVLEDARDSASPKSVSPVSSSGPTSPRAPSVNANHAED